MPYTFQSVAIGGLGSSFPAAVNSEAMAALLSLNALSLDAANGYLTADDGGITIIVPKGEYQFDASVPMVASSPLWLKGDPGGKTSFKFNGAACKLQWGDSLTTSNHLVGGGIADLSIDGTDTAETLVEVRVGAKFSSRNLSLSRTAKGTPGTTAALALLGAQNGIHDNPLFNATGGTALLLEYGAAGNQFHNMNSSGCYEDGRLGGVHDFVGAGGGPNNNKWFGGINERDTLDHLKPWNWYVGAGKNNAWQGMTYVLAEDASATAGVKVARVVPIWKIERQLAADGVTYYSLSDLNWTDCSWGGSVDSYADDLTGSGNYGANHYKWTYGFDVTGVVAEGLGQTHLFINQPFVMTGLREWVKDNTGAAGYIVVHAEFSRYSSVAGVDTTERMVGTGTSADDLRQRMRGPYESRAHKSDGTSLVFQGRKNDNTVTSAIYDDGAIELGAAGGPRVHTVSGAPAAADPHGSLALRTNTGTDTGSAFARENGAWRSLTRAALYIPAGAFMNTSGATASQDTAGRTALWLLPDTTTTSVATALYLEAWAAGYTIDLIWMPKDGVTASLSWSCDVRLERIVIPAGPGTTSIFNTTISTDTMTVGQWQTTQLASAYVPSATGHFALRVIRTGSDSFNGNIGVIAVKVTPQ